VSSQSIKNRGLSLQRLSDEAIAKVAQSARWYGRFRIGTEPDADYLADMVKLSEILGRGGLTDWQRQRVFEMVA
jgi:hypothetical protein